MSIEIYISDMERKAQELKDLAKKQLSEIHIPDVVSHTTKSESCGNKCNKTLSVLSYLLVGGGIGTLWSGFVAETTPRKVLTIALGTIELASGLISLTKPELLEHLTGEKKQNSETIANDDFDLSLTKNEIIRTLPMLQNNLSESWDDFLGSNKNILLQAIETSDIQDKGSLNDLAIKRSVLQNVSSNILGEINELEDNAENYKNFLDNFAQKCYATIDAAFEEQKSTVLKIAEVLNTK